MVSPLDQMSGKIILKKKLRSWFPPQPIHIHILLPLVRVGNNGADPTRSVYCQFLFGAMQESRGNDAEGINVNFTSLMLQKHHKYYSITIFKSVQPFELNTNFIYCYCHQDNKKYSESLVITIKYVFHILMTLLYSRKIKLKKWK